MSVTTVKNYTQNGTDPDLNEFARHTLPKIVDHLQRAKKPSPMIRMDRKTLAITAY
jgi:hypothetical protein